MAHPDSAPRPLRVLIVGAGIAGPALAYWLTRMRPPLPACDVTIVERHPELRSSGQQIDLRGQGVQAMRRMGIEAAVRARVVDEPGVHLVDRRGRSAAYLASNKSGRGAQTFSAEWEIMRGDLCHILYGLTRDLPGVRYVFGCSVERFTQEGDGRRGGPVHVTFSDGTEGEFDLLVGADGVGSRIRRHMFPDGRPDELDLVGISIAYFTIPPEEGDSDAAMACHLPGGRIAVTRRDRPDCLRVYLVHAGEDADLSRAHRHGTVREQKGAWARLFAHDMDRSWQVPRFLEGMLNSPLADDFYAQELAQVKIDSWSHGRVVLLGDSAFCPSPITGMGTSLALVAAYVLAGEIARACAKGPHDAWENLPAALAGYEKALRPFVRDVQDISFRWLADWAFPQTAWRIRLLHWVAWLITLLRIDRLAARFISDDRGSWSLPDYGDVLDHAA